MALLAVTRVCRDRPLEGELPIVAQLTGLTLYEARLRLVSPTPVLLHRDLPLEEAQLWVSLLRKRGHGAVAVDEQALPRADQIFEPADVELQPNAFVGRDRLGRSQTVPLDEVLALVRAVEVVEEVRTTEKVDKKLAIGRALLTGGLMLNKEVRESATDTRTDAERTLYLFRRTASEPIVLRQRSLRYTGMGDERGRTEHESFDKLAAWLQRNTPDAFHDDRLCAHKRRSTLQATSGTAKDYLAVSSGARETVLAAFLLVEAHLEQQL